MDSGWVQVPARSIPIWVLAGFESWAHVFKSNLRCTSSNAQHHSSVRLCFTSPLVTLQTLQWVGRDGESREQGGEDVIPGLFYKLFTLPVLWGLCVFQPIKNQGDPSPGTILTAIDNLVSGLPTPITNFFFN